MRVKIAMREGTFRPEDYRKNYRAPKLDTAVVNTYKHRGPLPIHQAPSLPGVYFVRCGKSGMIKIGYSGNIHRRLSTLQTAMPGKLEYIGAFEGTVLQEQQLHSQFASCRRLGEWFQPNDVMMRYLSKLFPSWIAGTERAEEALESLSRPG